jgi:hypothetical protein
MLPTHRHGGASDCRPPHYFQTNYRHEMVFIALDEDTGHMLGLVRLIAELDEK